MTPETIVPALTTITTEHVDLLSSKGAELGKASTEELMDRFSASDRWAEYAEECADFAGRSDLIEKLAMAGYGRTRSRLAIRSTASALSAREPKAVTRK